METIREHALERLEESGEELRGHQLAWSLAFAERAEPADRVRAGPFLPCAPNQVALIRD